jgi:hypothetical protein
MPWDWDKLKLQQEGSRGGRPQNMVEIIQKFKVFKLPRGRIILLLVVIVYPGGSGLMNIPAASCRELPS